MGWAFLVLLGLVTVYYIGSKAWSNPTLLVQNILDGLKLGFVYALIALGYTMVYGIVKLINFAHGDVFMVGAFTSFYAVSRFNLHLWPQAAFPAIAPSLSLVIGSLTVVLLSMAVCVIMAVTIERVAYKPLRDAPRIAALITAIGVSFFLEYFGALPFVFSAALSPINRPSPRRHGTSRTEFIPSSRDTASPDNTISFSNIFLIIAAASILVQILLQFIVKKTKIGIAMRAASYDKSTARLMGINVDRVISFTFAIGAAFAGLGGVLYAIAYSSISTQLGILPGPQGLRRGGSRRNRQHPRRLRRRPHHGPGRGHDDELHIDAHARCRGLHHPHYRPPREADRPVRRARAGKGLGGRHGTRISRQHHRQDGRPHRLDLRSPLGPRPQGPLAEGGHHRPRLRSRAGRLRPQDRRLRRSSPPSTKACFSRPSP